MPDPTNLPIRPLLTLTLLVGLIPAHALAQSGGNAQALAALGTPSAHHKAATHPHHAAHRGPAAHQAATSQSLAAAAPEVPAAAPPPPIIKAPLINVSLHPEPPPPPVLAVASAVGRASPLAGGTRISFGANTADMNPDTLQAVRSLAARMQAEPAIRAQIDAYAPGAADDPSSPRRTALERGLAARAVLINQGVASTRIYVRAIGQPHDDGPADRVDLICSDSTQQTGSTP